ncbi:MAG: Stp1/IreP family PP2C-type Ser/Thr phosphatase [Ignavibacteriae bacterium]|nr:MAG: Stp1/IreP family PP2C-type Ser/Thr phosphatase [Ignavibacteriota bacterium]
MEEIKTLNISFGNKTDVGRVRQRNEDYLESFSSPFGQVFIVCDGMGGHIGGEIASHLAVASIKNVIIKNPNNLSGTSAIIEDAINKANRDVIQKTHEQPDLRGMGTTVVILIVKNSEAYIGHVGDSRLYLVRDNKIYLMTRDHSFVQNLVDQGLLTWEEAEKHPRKNEIMQALGIFEKVNPEVNHTPLKLYKNDTFVLCSDGLSGMVTDEKIKEIVTTHNPISASDKLVEDANANGGNDNITVQVVKIDGADELPESEKNIPPIGAILKGDKHIASSNTITKELNGSPATHAEHKKKQLRMLIPFLGILVLIIIAFIYFDPFGFKNEGNVKTTVNDSTNTNVSNDTGSAFYKEENMVSQFLKTIFKGKLTSKYIQQPKLNIVNIKYTPINGATTDYAIEDLRKNINQNDLKFYRVINFEHGDSLHTCTYSVEWGVKDNILNTYKLTYTINKDQIITITTIEFIKSDSKKEDKIQDNIKPKETEKKPETDKDKQEVKEPEKTPPENESVDKKEEKKPEEPPKQEPPKQEQPKQEQPKEQQPEREQPKKENK